MVAAVTPRCEGLPWEVATAPQYQTLAPPRCAATGRGRPGAAQSFFHPADERVLRGQNRTSSSATLIQVAWAPGQRLKRDESTAECGPLPARGIGSIRRRMTQVLTVRVPPDLMAKAAARAAQLGLDRGKYVRALIEQDVIAGAKERRKRRFASEDFIGSTPLGRGPYTNRRVRAIVRERLASVRETNR